MRATASTAVIVLTVIILLAATAVYSVTKYNGPPSQSTAPSGSSTSPANSTTSPATTSQAGETSAEESVKLSGYLNISVESRGSVIKISKYHVTVRANNSTVTIDMVLPNPCYKADLRYNSPDNTLLLTINSPPKGKACIQVLKPISLSTSIEPPPTGKVMLKVYLDGKQVAEAVIPLSS